MILNNTISPTDINFGLEFGKSTELLLDIKLYADMGDLFQDFKRELDIELNNELHEN